LFGKSEDCNQPINLTLGIVRHILNLAANDWKFENKMTWLAHASKITMLDLTGRQRPPRPITWAEQERLISHLPKHLARMATFALNTGVRDNVVCNLRWSWEVKIPELGISVFDVPRLNVKGRKHDRVAVCNSVAQSIIESVRGQHPEFVFVDRRERIKDFDQLAAMPYRPIQTINNTAWQTARRKAGLDDLHVHDLRHTVGMRLREAGVPQVTTSDLLWHVNKDMTHEYTLAQIAELHGAIEKIREDSGRWNRSLAMLKREQEERRHEVDAITKAESSS
jgi:integrase